MSNETLCDMHVASAGLPYRTEPLLARERRSFPGMVAALFSPGKGDIDASPLTVGALTQALDAQEPVRSYTAAFLIGRCKARDVAADTTLTARLEDMLAQRSEADATIEAAMSLVLRGGSERGGQMLRTLLRSTDPLGDQYKAAFYLAQMGDPSGYKALVTTLHHDIPHYRLMALRHALAFVPYQGQQIEGLEVDVRKLLVERLADPDTLVRCEVPFYLEELKVSDLRALLEPVEQHDPSDMVRTAAHMVLERNR